MLNIIISTNVKIFILIKISKDLSLEKIAKILETQDSFKDGAHLTYNLDNTLV